jgi:hypothetical protein
MRNTADVTGGKPIAVFLQSISGVSAINLLVTFYDIHGGRREVLFFYFVLDTTRDTRNNISDRDCTEFRLMQRFYNRRSAVKSKFSNVKMQLKFVIIRNIIIVTTMLRKFT